MILAGLYEKPLEIHGQIYCAMRGKGGITPGLETQDQLDVVGVLDTGDVVEGLGVNGLASGSSIVSGWVVSTQLSVCQ